jgi:hypothetical protein
LTELSVTARITPEREEGLQLGARAAHDVDETVDVHVDHAREQCIAGEVDVGVERAGGLDVAPLPEPSAVTLLERVDRILARQRHVQQVDCRVAVDVQRHDVWIGELDRACCRRTLNRDRTLLERPRKAAAPVEEHAVRSAEQASGRH